MLRCKESVHMTSGQLWVGKSNARDDRNARTKRQVLGLWDGPCLGGILSEVNELETIHCNQEACRHLPPLLCLHLDDTR